MALAKKPTLVKSLAPVKKGKHLSKAAQFVADAPSQSKNDGATFELVKYTFRLNQGLLDRVKSAAAGQSADLGRTVTVTSFMIDAILAAVKKYEAGE